MTVRRTLLGVAAALVALSGIGVAAGTVLSAGGTTIPRSVHQILSLNTLDDSGWQ